MIDMIRGWLLGIVGAAILSAIAMSLTPKGRVRDVTRLVCGIVMALSLIQPVLKLDFDAYSLNLSEYRGAADSITDSIQENNDRLSRLIIEEECAAYILDKAQVLGLTAVTASVTAKWGDEGCWYPYEAMLDIQGAQSDKDRLAAIIESELGIPRERQSWSTENEH